MKMLLAALFSVLVFTATTVQAATIDLYEWVVNIDGNASGYANGTSIPTPPSVNTAGFDTGTGLGTITVSVTGAGLHNVITYFDHEIDERLNTFFNEVGVVHDAPASGQHWQIDNPFGDGTIFGNVTDTMLLDNMNHSTSPNDVAMALGWTFSLLDQQTAYLSFSTFLSAPTAGFYLEQYDPNSQASVYFNSERNIRGGTEPVPEPSTALLLGAGLLGLGYLGRKKRNT